MFSVNLRTVTDTAEDLKKEADNKLSNPFYFNLVMYEIIFHWKFIVVLFFVSENNILQHYNILKVEYLSNLLYFNGYSNNYTYCWWWFSVSLFGPIVMTYLSVWKFDKWFLRSAKLYTLDNEIETQIEITKRRNRKIQVIKKDIEIASEEKEIEKQKELLISKDEKWAKEYESFKLKPIFKNFIKIIDSVYTHNGRVNANRYSSQAFEIPQDLLIYSDTNNIIKFTDISKTVIELTEKGKYFVKLFSEDENKI